jgi:hypothetical protein
MLLIEVVHGPHLETDIESIIIIGISFSLETADTLS